MEIYVKVIFWLNVASFIIRIAIMNIRDWPHTKKPESLAEYTGETLFVMAFMIWGGIVLWL